MIVPAAISPATIVFAAISLVVIVPAAILSAVIKVPTPFELKPFRTRADQ